MQALYIHTERDKDNWRAIGFLGGKSLCDGNTIVLAIYLRKLAILRV